MAGADRLATAAYEVVGRFADASNATLLARLLDRDPAPLPDEVTFEDLEPDDLAVYKPARGEAPLWDFPPATLHLREVAAHEVSQALGWELVPPTVLRDDGPFGAGALQQYVVHDPQFHYFQLRDSGDEHLLAQLRAMVLFDLVIDNADRKGGHVLLEQPGSRVRCIDHGVSFHVEHKLRTVAWDFASQPVPADLRADVAGLVEWVTGPGRPRLEQLLDAEEIHALSRRASLAARRESFPEPIGPRPFPWPLL